MYASSSVFTSLAMLIITRVLVFYLLMHLKSRPKLWKMLFIFVVTLAGTVLNSYLLLKSFNVLSACEETLFFQGFSLKGAYLWTIFSHFSQEIIALSSCYLSFLLYLFLKYDIASTSLFQGFVPAILLYLVLVLVIGNPIDRQSAQPAHLAEIDCEIPSIQQCIERSSREFKSEELSLLNILPEGVMLLRHDGTPMQTNSAMAQILECEPEDLVKTTL